MESLLRKFATFFSKGERGSFFVWAQFNIGGKKRVAINQTARMIKSRTINVTGRIKECSKSLTTQNIPKAMAINVSNKRLTATAVRASVDFPSPDSLYQ